MEGKKLLIVTQHFWPEAFRVNDLAAGFIERGWQVDVLCGLPNYPKGCLLYTSSADSGLQWIRLFSSVRFRVLLSSQP